MYLKDKTTTRTCKMREHYSLLDHTFFERLLYPIKQKNKIRKCIRQIFLFLVNAINLLCKQFYFLRNL
jgi:hypothetical protein